MDRKYFEVSVKKYDPAKDFCVYRPASLDCPRDSAVMFVTERFLDRAGALKNCRNCLVFWPDSIPTGDKVDSSHAVKTCADPHKEYCRFFQDNKITYLPKPGKYRNFNGAYIAEGAKIGQGCTIFPGALIGPEAVIGDRVYIGAGVKIQGEVYIGDDAVIRENAVIGADGLSTDRDENGRALTMPQFGGVTLEDGVQIGALTVIARGAIDHTVIRRGSKIDNSTFISHNVIIGEDVFVVGETIMFGSSSAGDKSYISGGAVIRDGRHIGAGAKVGMGAVVVRDVPARSVVKGNPAK